MSINHVDAKPSCEKLRKSLAHARLSSLFGSVCSAHRASPEWLFHIFWCLNKPDFNDFVYNLAYCVSRMRLLHSKSAFVAVLNSCQALLCPRVMTRERSQIVAVRRCRSRLIGANRWISGSINTSFTSDEVVKRLNITALRNFILHFSSRPKASREAPTPRLLARPLII